MSAPAGPRAPQQSAHDPRSPAAPSPNGRRASDRRPPALDIPDREARDPHCLSAAAADELLVGAPWRRFAVLGDGMAEGLGDAVPGYQDAGWADRVAAALARRRLARGDLAYRNVARSELRTAEIRATQLDPVLSFRPDLALVVAGSNDILRGDFERCDDVLADYDAIVTALQQAGADVITATIFDVTRSSRVPEASRPALHRRLDHLAGHIRLVARARRTVHLDLAGHPAASEPDLYSADLRFVTRRGHAIAAAALVRRLGRHLGNPDRAGR